MCHHFVPMFMRLFNVVSKDFATVAEFLNQHFPSAAHPSVIILQSRRLIERSLIRHCYYRYSSGTFFIKCCGAGNVKDALTGILSSLLVLPWPWLSCVSITVVVGENRIYYTWIFETWLKTDILRWLRVSYRSGGDCFKASLALASKS